MAGIKRVGANWFTEAEVAALANTFNDYAVDEIGAYYSVGAGPDIWIETVVFNPYLSEDPPEDDGDPVTLYGGSYNGEIPPGAVGEGVVLKLYPADRPQDAVEFDGYTIITDAATSVIISPSSSTIRINRTRQFTATFYAADNLPTDNHDAVIWGTNASGGGQGSIDTDTGLFTAGTAAGGPYVVSATAGELSDTAQITVVEITKTKVPTISGSANIGDMI
jgi:hypothetical protein